MGLPPWPWGGAAVVLSARLGYGSRCGRIARPDSRRKSGIRGTLSLRGQAPCISGLRIQYDGGVRWEFGNTAAPLFHQLP